MTGVASALAQEPDAGESKAAGAGGRIVRGLAANVWGIGITLVIQLVSVPVFLVSWGVSVYGEWLVLSAVPTYVALSDLSFSSVAGNSMVMLEAAGRRAAVITLGRRLWSMVTIMSGLAVVAAVVVALVFGSAFGSGAAIPAGEARTVLIVLFLRVAVGNQYGVLDAWYRADGRYPLSSALRHLGRLLEFGALMCAVLLGASPSTAAIASLTGGCVGFGVSWIILRRTVPWSVFRPELPHRDTFRELFAPGVAYMAFPVGNALSLQGFTIVIGATLGPAAVVVFSTTRTITRVAMQAMNSINSAIWPELSRAIGSNRVGEARAILRRATQGAIVVSLALVGLLALFGQSIIQSWTHGIVDPPRSLLYVLLLIVVVNSMSNTLSTVLFATNRHKRMAGVYLFSVAVALLGGITLGSALGLPGMAIALLIVEVGMAVYVLPASLRIVQDRPGPFLRSALDFRETVRIAKSRLRLSM